MLDRRTTSDLIKRVLWRNILGEQNPCKSFRSNEVVNKRCFIHLPFLDFHVNERSYRQRIGFRKSNGVCISIGYAIWITSVEASAFCCPVKSVEFSWNIFSFINAEYPNSEWIFWDPCMGILIYMYCIHGMTIQLSKIRRFLSAIHVFIFFVGIFCHQYRRSAVA